MIERRSHVSAGLSRAVEICLIVLLLVSPLLISTYLKQVFNTPKYVLVGGVALLLGCVYFVDCLFEQRLRVPRSASSWCLIGFVGWGGLSLLWSSDMAVASRDFGYHAGMLMIFLAAFLYGREEERVDNLLHFPIAAGVLAAGFGLMQYFDIDRVLFELVPGWSVPLVGGCALVALALGRLPLKELSRPMLFLAALTGVAAGIQDMAVYVLGLLIVGLWVFYRSLDPKNPPITLFLRFVVGLLLLLLASLLDPQVLLLLGVAVLLDEAADSGQDELAGLLLGVGFLAVAITAGMRGWDLRFLILPKKPEEVVKIYSLMGHRNYLAGFLIAVMPLAVTRLVAVWCVPPAGEPRLTPARVWKVVVYLLTILVMGVVIVLCHTRGAWIGGCASMGFILVFLALKYRPLRPFGLLGVLLGVVVLAAGIFGWKRITLPDGRVLLNPLNRHIHSAGSRMSESLNIQAGSAFQRALIYRTTWRIIFDHPINCLFGTGIGTYGLNYMPAQKHVLQVPANRKYQMMTNKSIYAHNEYWHYWSEVGLVGLLLLFGFLYRLAEAAHRRLRQENAGVPNLMFLGMCASLLATGTHNFFTFDWHLAYSGGIFFALAGIVLAQSDPAFSVWSWRRRLVGSSRSGETRAHLQGEVLDGVLYLEVAVSPVAEAEAGLILVDPSGRKNPVAPVEAGRYEVEAEEENGTWRVLLDDLDRKLPPLEFQVEPPRSGMGTVLGLVGLVLVAVPLARSLAGELLRDHYWRDGFLKFRMRRFEEAFLDFEQALAADATKGEVLFDFGRALMDSGRNVPAIKVFLQAKATFVDPANDHNIALCYFKEGNLEKAEEHYRKALTLNEIYEQSLANLSYMLIQQGRDDEAIPMLELGASLYDINHRFPTSLAIIMARKGNLPEAKKYFDKALALNPDRASVYTNAGTVYYNMGLLPEAQRAFRKSLELDASSEVAKQKLAMVELAIWGQAAKEQPQNLDVRRNYALSLLATTQVGAAATEAKNILKAYPMDATTRFVYARALELQGYKDDATREYQRALESSPDATLKGRIERHLGELGAPGAGGG